MIAGGLAGATPHMISASITAISRVVFEFKGKLVALRSHRCRSQSNTSSYNH